MSEQMAFAGDLGTEMNTVSESGYSLQNTTISMSTLVVLVAAVVTVWTMRGCFWRIYGGKKGVQEEDGRGQSMNYGTL